MCRGCGCDFHDSRWLLPKCLVSLLATRTCSASCQCFLDCGLEKHTVETLCGARHSNDWTITKLLKCNHICLFWIVVSFFQLNPLYDLGPINRGCRCWSCIVNCLWLWYLCCIGWVFVIIIIKKKTCV